MKELNLCRRLECTWGELQEMPEDTVLLWEAIMTGEEHARKAKAAAGR